MPRWAMVGLVLVATLSGCLGPQQNPDASNYPEGQFSRGEASSLNITETRPTQNSSTNLSVACHNAAVTAVTEEVREATGNSPGNVLVENPYEVTPDLVILLETTITREGEPRFTPVVGFNETVAAAPQSVTVNMTAGDAHHECDFNVYVEQNVLFEQ